MNKTKIKFDFIAPPYNGMRYDNISDMKWKLLSRTY